jgi:GNAT superfamily N-acetyltransferase
MGKGIETRRLAGAELAGHLDALADVLHATVEAGASVSYMWPFTPEQARDVFVEFSAEVDAGRRFLLGAFADGRVVGTVQVILSLPPNQPHRAEITKLLVHPAARGRGVGRLLMEHAEAEARAEGRTLLVLDTVTGSAADRLYRRLGWTALGTIPDFALYPDGRPCDATFFWKSL